MLRLDVTIGRFRTSSWGRAAVALGVASIAAMTACGGTEAGNGPGVGGSGGGAGGAGGTPSPSDARTFDVGCLRPDVDLSFAVELSVSLDAPFATSGPTEVTFAPTVTMRQETAIALIAANVSSIDITSMSVPT